MLMEEASGQPKIGRQWTASRSPQMRLTSNSIDDMSRYIQTTVQTIKSNIFKALSITRQIHFNNNLSLSAEWPTSDYEHQLFEKVKWSVETQVRA